MATYGVVCVMLFPALAGASSVRDGIYDVQNVHSGLYLNVAGGSMRGRANVWLWDNPGSEDSKWHLRRVDGGTYTLQNTRTGHYLSVADSGEHKGTNVQMSNSVDNGYTQWVLHEVPNGDGTSFAWRNSKTGLFLNAAGGHSAKGTNVQVWDNPGSTHSHWELIGFECHDARPGEKCHDDVQRALNDGSAGVEWYPELSANSSAAEIQAHLHFCYWKRCPLPCTTTGLHGCTMIGRFWNDSACEDAAVGTKCYHEVHWAQGEGIREHPEWYEGLDNSSSVKQFQARLYQGAKAGLETNHCPEPCCHDALPGELCHQDAMWGMLHGINLPDFKKVYPPSMTNQSAFTEFQAYLHLCYPVRCPMPCSPSELMDGADNSALHCPDA